MSLLFTVTLSADTSIFEHKTEKPAGVDNQAMCKLFTEKAADYKATMRDDEYAHVTLKSYQDRAAFYCKE